MCTFKQSGGTQGTENLLIRSTFHRLENVAEGWKFQGAIASQQAVKILAMRPAVNSHLLDGNKMGAIMIGHTCPTGIQHRKRGHAAASWLNASSSHSWALRLLCRARHETGAARAHHITARGRGRLCSFPRYAASTGHSAFAGWLGTFGGTDFRGLGNPAWFVAPHL